MRAEHAEGKPVAARLLRPRQEAAALTALVTAYIASSAWVLRIPAVLGHDESVYALMARHWLSGTPSTGAAAHRAPLLPLLGLPTLAAGGGEMALQSLGVVSGVVALAGVWWLGRMIRGPAAGLAAAAVFISSPYVMQAGTEFLTDLPATALLVLMAALLWQQLAVRREPNRLLLLVAPLAWAAYELRYGSALVVIVIFLTSAVLFRHTIRAHLRLVTATLALLAALLVPHLVNSAVDLGHPFDRILATADVAGRAYLGEGVVDYVRWFPVRLAGPIAALLMAVGLVGALVRWITHRRGAHRDGTATPGRALTFLVVPALLHVAAIGIASHGEPRFVFVAIALLCVAGAAVTTDLLTTMARRASRATWVALIGVVLVVALAVQSALVVRWVAVGRSASERHYAVLLESARALDRRAGERCSVLTSYGPQITWLTGCATYHFGSPPAPGREESLTDDAWMLLYQGGKRQPQGDTLAHYLRIAEEVEVWHGPSNAALAWGRLYRVDPTA